MAFTHGKGGVFKLDNASAALTAYTAYIDTITFTPKGDVAETSVLGLTSKTYVSGLKDCTITIAGPYDPVITAALNSALATATLKNFEFDPQGSAAGTDKWTGLCICTDISVSTSLSGAVKYSATLQVSGNVTLASN